MSQNWRPLFLVIGAFALFGLACGGQAESAENVADNGDSEATADSLVTRFTATQRADGNVLLQWPVHPETDVAGYRIYIHNYRTNANYVRTIAGRFTTQYLWGAVWGDSLGFQYTAFDIAGNESAKSAYVFAHPPPDSTWFNPSPGGRYAFIHSYVSNKYVSPQSGLYWHPGQVAGDCYNPDPTKRTPGMWGIVQVDYRGSSFFSLGAEQWMWQIEQPSPPNPTYAGRKYRWSKGWTHRKGACRGLKTGSFTLHLTCNGWTQSSVAVSCASVSD